MFLNKIKELINNGINENDIAVLCYTNSILELYYYLKEMLPGFKNKNRYESSKLIKSTKCKALIKCNKIYLF